MSAVEKLLRLAGDGQRSTLVEDPAGDLVLAAVTALGELRALLAGDDDEDDYDRKGEDTDSGSESHFGHAAFKAMRKKGMPEDRAKKLCARADKRAKTSALADAAAVALAGLAVPGHDWVQASAQPEMVAGSFTYNCTHPDWADPGYLDRPRFPVGTAEHARLSLSYVEQGKDRERYSPDQWQHIRERVWLAARQRGITSGRDDEAAAATALLELAVLDQEDRDKEKSKGHTIAGSDDYPIPDKAHLSAAVARYKQGKLAGHSKEQVAAHIRKHAKRLGEQVNLTSGSGLEEAAEALVLARSGRPVGDGGALMSHGPFTGTHSHSHFQSAVHDHPHQHFGDSSHEGGPAHRPGSRPGGRAGY